DYERACAGLSAAGRLMAACRLVTTGGLVTASWLVAAGRLIAAAALNIFARCEVFDRDFGVMLFLLFHVASPVGLFWFGEVLLAPNNNRVPPVTVFLGIRSSKRMPVDFFPPGFAGGQDLPTVFCFWDTKERTTRMMPSTG